MLFKKINSSKLKLRRTFFHIFLIISYMITFNSCMTTYNYTELPDRLGKETSSDISKIELNDGTIINCKDKLIKFETGADSVKYIVIKTYTVGKEYKTYWTEKRIPEKDVFKVYMEKSEVNGTQTTFLVIGIAFAVTIVALILGSSKSGFFGGSSWH
ncbi:MAG: hypothetical protein KDD00_05495 [Ignavibacteriae bacterium]|nr:hypothetical protein [Ignavibacteriota bacterium]